MAGARRAGHGRSFVSGGSVLRRLGDLSGAMRLYRGLPSVGTPREELLALQQRRLVETARHAAASSPLYRELYADIELSEDLDIRALPIVTKTMLMERFDEWVGDPQLRLPEVEAHLEQVRGDELYLGAYRCLPTGGTTGRKGIFVYDRKEWRECLCVFLRLNELGGARPRLGRRLRIATVGATSPLHMMSRFGMSTELGLYSLRRLDARTPLVELVAALNEHRPDNLFAYASMASLLAIEQLEGRLRIAPRDVCTTSEVRTEEMTANIRAAWDVEPFNLYATTESIYAVDCEHHQGMHLFEDLGMMEVLDPNGDTAADGVAGAKVLVTSFIKHSQPLLRCEMSDIVAMDTAPCPCGRPHARLVALDGRSEEVLCMAGAGGGLVTVHPHTLKSPMAALPGLRQYKIIHHNDRLQVLIVLRDGTPADELSGRVETTLGSALIAAGVANPQLDVSIVTELPREHSHSAKFKLIESHSATGSAVPTPTS
jgi:phenylacetate-CoA ligase